MKILKLLLLSSFMISAMAEDDCFHLSSISGLLEYSCIINPDGEKTYSDGALRVGDKVAIWDKRYTGQVPFLQWLEFYNAGKLSELNAYDLYEISSFLGESSTKRGQVVVRKVKNGKVSKLKETFPWNRLSPLMCHENIDKNYHENYKHVHPSDTSLYCGSLIRVNVVNSKQVVNGYVQWMTYDGLAGGLSSLEDEFRYPYSEGFKREKLFEVNEDGRNFEKLTQHAMCDEDSIQVGSKVKFEKMYYYVQLILEDEICVTDVKSVSGKCTWKKAENARLVID